MLLGGGYMVVLLVLILSIVKGMEIKIYVFYVLVYIIKSDMILKMDLKKMDLFLEWIFWGWDWLLVVMIVVV